MTGRVIADGFGNYSIGTVMVPVTANDAMTQLGNLLLDSIGSTRHKIYTTGSWNLIQWRPNVASETLTGDLSTASTTATTLAPDSRAAIRLPFGNGGAYFYSQQLNSSLTTTPSTVSSDLYISSEAWNSSGTFYATANNKSICFAAIASSGAIYFSWVGLLSNVYNQVDVYPLPLSTLIIHGASGVSAYRVRNVGQTTAQGFITNNALANYTPTPLSGTYTQTNRSTDLYLRDSNATTGNPAIGYCDNLLFATAGSYTNGQFYQVSNGLGGSVIQGSSKNIYLCVGTFYTYKVLMRVVQ